MSEAPYEESHLDSEGNEIEREPVGPVKEVVERSTIDLGVPEGDLRRERLRPLPGDPRRDPSRQTGHEPRRVLPLAPEREVRQPGQPMSDDAAGRSAGKAIE